LETQEVSGTELQLGEAEAAGSGGAGGDGSAAGDATPRHRIPWKAASAIVAGLLIVIIVPGCIASRRLRRLLLFDHIHGRSASDGTSSPLTKAS
jgi:hypothetical protein